MKKQSILFLWEANKVNRSEFFYKKKKLLHGCDLKYAVCACRELNKFDFSMITDDPNVR